MFQSKRANTSMFITHQTGGLNTAVSDQLERKHVCVEHIPPLPLLKIKL